LGVFCSIVGALGLLRFPDVFIRIHAATVSVIGGAVVSIFGAALLTFPFNLSFSIKAFLIAGIIFLTSPVGSHAILRAAHKSKTPMWNGTVCDKLREAEKNV